MCSISWEAARFSEPRWATFRQDHARWLARYEKPTEVLYRLPKKVREKLAMRRLHGRSILEPADVAAEEDFDALCLGFFAEGLYQGMPVSHAYLRPRLILPPAKQLQEMGLDVDMKAVKAATNKADEVQLRNKGYVGRLLTDVPFLQARDALRAAWIALPADERPGFPLPRTTIPFATDSEAVNYFQTLLDAFCERYSLQSMATWELPDPVGPLLAGEQYPPHILKPCGVVIAVPSHFPIMDKDQLVEMIGRQQQMHVQEAGLDPTCVGPRSAETYAHLFEIDHYERVVIGRYGRRPRPKGFTSQLNEALMAYLDIGQDHLRTLRKALAAFKRGKPHTGKWTR